MDCRQIASQLAQLSADDVPSATAVAMWEHLSRCPECEQEWKVFQATLLVLSTAPQPVMTAEQSAQIWQNCSEQLHRRIEERRLAAQRPAFFNWARTQPRWGWAALGGALAVLGGVWWLTPQDSDTLTEQVAQILPAPSRAGQTIRAFAPAAGMMDMNEAPAPGPLMTFQPLPPGISPMVNNHTEMAFGPFADQVGTNLVSHAALTQRSATAPVASLPASSGAVAPANTDDAASRVGAGAATTHDTAAESTVALTGTAPAAGRATTDPGRANFSAPALPAFPAPNAVSQRP